MNNYDREQLKTFANQGGLINIIMRNLPNNAIMQDGEVERLSEEIYSLIIDSRRNTLPPDRLYSSVKKLAALLDVNMDMLCNPTLLSIDEVAIKMDVLFRGLYESSEISEIQWIMPTALFFKCSIGDRSQKCRIDVYKRDLTVCTTIADSPLKDVQADLGLWLQRLHKLLIASKRMRYAISPALNISNSYATITAGIHIPGENIQLYDILNYTHQLVNVGDELEKIFNTGNKDQF